MTKNLQRQVLFGRNSCFLCNQEKERCFMHEKNEWNTAETLFIICEDCFRLAVDNPSATIELGWPVAYRPAVNEALADQIEKNTQADMNKTWCESRFYPGHESEKEKVRETRPVKHSLRDRLGIASGVTCQILHNDEIAKHETCFLCGCKNEYNIFYCMSIPGGGTSDYIICNDCYKKTAEGPLVESGVFNELNRNKLNVALLHKENLNKRAKKEVFFDKLKADIKDIGTIENVKIEREMLDGRHTCCLCNCTKDQSFIYRTTNPLGGFPIAHTVCSECFADILGRSAVDNMQCEWDMASREKFEGALIRKDNERLRMENCDLKRSLDNARFRVAKGKIEKEEEIERVKEYKTVNGDYDIEDYALDLADITSVRNREQEGWTTVLLKNGKEIDLKTFFDDVVNDFKAYMNSL